MQPEADHAEMKRMLKRQMELLEENNRLLRKLHRGAVWAFWFRLSSYLLIIGAPIVLYYYVIEPYLQTVGTDYHHIMETVNSLSGLKDWESYFKPPQ